MSSCPVVMGCDRSGSGSSMRGEGSFGFLPLWNGPSGAHGGGGANSSSCHLRLSWFVWKGLALGVVRAENPRPKPYGEASIPVLANGTRLLAKLTFHGVGATGRVNLPKVTG